MLKSIFSPSERVQSPKHTACTAAIAVFCMVLFVDVLLSAISYVNVRNETRAYISSMAKTAAVLTNVDLHQTLQDPGQKGTPEYLEVQAPYRALLKANPDLFYIYTLVPTEKDMAFIIDTQQMGEDLNEEDVGERKSTANVMEEYSEATETLKKAMQTQSPLVEDQPYSDQWGTFISAYAPLKNSKGEFVGIVGADMLATPFFDRLHNVMMGFIGGIIMAGLLAFATYKAVYNYGMNEVTHNRAALRRLAYMESFQQEMSQIVESIADLGHRIAERVEQVSQASAKNVVHAEESSKSIQGSADCINSIALVSTTLLETLAELEHSLRSNDSSLKTIIETLQEPSAGGNLSRHAEVLKRVCEANSSAIKSCQDQREMVGQITDDSKTVAASAERVEISMQEISEMTAETDRFLSDIVKTMRSLSEQNDHLKQQVSTFLTMLRQTGIGPENIRLAA